MDGNDAIDAGRNIEDMTFREAMSDLEATVQVLESGTLELEASIERYAHGVALLASLQKRLAEAEQKVDVLMGELAEAPADEVQDSTLLKA